MKKVDLRRDLAELLAINKHNRRVGKPVERLDDIRYLKDIIKEKGGKAIVIPNTLN